MPPDALAGSARILLMRLDNAGDVIMLGPSVRAIRAAHPEAHIALLASRAGAAAAELLPGLDEIAVARVAWQDAGGGPADGAAEQQLVERLAAGSWDAVVVFTSFSQTPFPAGYAALLAGIPIRAGQSADFGGSVLSHQVRPAPWAGHQADRNLHLVEGLGVPVVARGLDVKLPGSARRRIADLLAEADVAGPPAPIVVVPGASAASRRPNPHLVAAAVRRIHDATYRPVVVAGTQRERPLAESIVAAVPGAVSLAGRTSFAELAALIERAGLVVCANSASMHLADALRRPVVVFFAGTDLESQWGPRQTPAALLRRDTDCHPCYLMDCPFQNACLEVDPADVADAALRLIANAGVTSNRSRQEDRWTAFAS
ncbi:MAG: glycosyltransferase family 9 protein [Chloroflexota bacterium]